LGFRAAPALLALLALAGCASRAWRDPSRSRPRAHGRGPGAGTVPLTALSAIL